MSTTLQHLRVYIVSGTEAQPKGLIPNPRDWDLTLTESNVRQANTPTFTGPNVPGIGCTPFAEWASRVLFLGHKGHAPRAQK